jgi:hypothetical protein
VGAADTLLTILYSYCTHTILYSYSTHTVLILYSTHTVLILYSYYTLLILYSYCTHTVLILYKVGAADTSTQQIFVRQLRRQDYLNKYKGAVNTGDASGSTGRSKSWLELLDGEHSTLQELDDHIVSAILPEMCTHTTVLMHCTHTLYSYTVLYTVFIMYCAR